MAKSPVETHPNFGVPLGWKSWKCICIIWKYLEMLTNIQSTSGCRNNTWKTFTSPIFTVFCPCCTRWETMTVSKPAQNFVIPWDSSLGRNQTKSALPRLGGVGTYFEDGSKHAKTCTTVYDSTIWDEHFLGPISAARGPQGFDPQLSNPPIFLIAIMRSLLHHPYMLEYAGLSEATAKSPLVFHHCPSKKRATLRHPLISPSYRQRNLDEIWL